MPVTATGIAEMSLVILPVADQDRSIGFYEGIGLEKRIDTPFAGGQLRWVEVYAPQGNTGIALCPPPGGAEVQPRPTGITFRSENIDETHASFVAQGIDVDAEVMRPAEGSDGVPNMFWFRDPDGYSLMVVSS